MQDVVEKLGLGDRAFLAGDYRKALFAYQDAVYMAPQHAPARVAGTRIPGARYPAQAIVQAEQAPAAEPASEARRLLQDAQSSARLRPRPCPQRPSRVERGGPASPDNTRTASSYVFRLTPEPESAAPAPEQEPNAMPHRQWKKAAAARTPSGSESCAPRGPGRIDGVPAGEGLQGSSGRCAYARGSLPTALDLPSATFEAVREPSEAIAGNPRLAVDTPRAEARTVSAGSGSLEDYRAALT
jgi:hypothetical protein